MQSSRVCVAVCCPQQGLSGFSSMQGVQPVRDTGRSTKGYRSPVSLGCSGAPVAGVTSQSCQRLLLSTRGWSRTCMRSVHELPWLHTAALLAAMWCACCVLHGRPVVGLPLLHACAQLASAAAQVLLLCTASSEFRGAGRKLTPRLQTRTCAVLVWAHASEVSSLLCLTRVHKRPCVMPNWMWTERSCCCGFAGFARHESAGLVAGCLA